MKTKNHIFYLIIVIVALVYSCDKTNQDSASENLGNITGVDLKVRSSTDECFDGDDCTQLLDSAVQLISVSGYSPCLVYAVYDLWVCDEFEVSKKFVINNFQVGLISNGCDSLLDRWDSIANIAYDYTQVNYEMDLFYAAAKTSLERYVMGQFFANSANRDTFPCAGGMYGVLSTEFYTALCYKWCQIDINTTPPYSILTQIICGEACCAKTIDWCWDSSSNTYHFTDPSYTDFGDCGTSPSYLCGGTMMGGDCDDHECEP